MSKLKYIWLFLVACIVALNIASYIANPNGDATGNVMLLLGALGFPLSIVPTLLVLSYVGYLVPEASNVFVFGGICISYVVTGLLQWFWLVPAITRRFRGTSHNKSKHADL
jgi:hypothetical protein